MFKIGDYVNNKDKKKNYVIHLKNQWHVDVINATGDFRHATQEEIEKYHWEEFE